MINLFHINQYQVDTSLFDHSLHGSIVQEVEEKFANYVGAKYACSLSSATNAIFLTFLNKNVTVKVPSMIPPVVLNAVINGGNKISFTDDVTWVGSSYTLHEFESEGYRVIDSAQKVSKNQFKNEASPNDLMIFSFYPTKPVGSLDGGIIVSDDYEKIKWFKEAALNGMSYSKNNWDREIKFPGWKMYMNTFQCFIANQNLEKLESKNKRLSEVRDRYNLEFSLNNISGHLYRLRVSNRNSFVEAMRSNGIACGIHYAAAHLHPVYQKYCVSNTALPKSELEHNLTVSIPYHEELTDYEIETIIKSVRKHGDILEER